MDRKPLQQVVGRATRDAAIIVQKSTGEKLTDKHGNPIVGFGIAQSDGYSDDAKTTFYDVTTGNPGLVAAALDPKNGIRKGASVVAEGNIEERGEYNDKVWATKIGIVTWFQRSKPGEAVQATAQDDDDDDF